MNGTATRFLRLCVSLAGLVTLGWVLTGQAAKPVRHSLPTDWSHRHLIFSHPGSPEQAARVSQDPRYLQQVYRREQQLALPVAAETDTQLANRFSHTVSSVKARPRKFHRDWAEDLGSGGSVGAGNYPAKFSFNIHAAFCDAATTPDYVVFSTGLAGSLSQASVVAYDNLYSGCGGTKPLTYWAYNTGGTVKTSPVLSLDGSQVAFVQTLAGAATLVTIKWKAADGTVGTPSTPTVVASMSVCIAVPCMTLTPLHGALAVITDDTTSSVFYDYANDVAWVGGTSGWLHKITGLFNGTPAEVITGGFPVQVNAGNTLSSPVYDSGSNSVFVVDAGGVLYRVSATGVVTASGQLAFGTGIVEGPIVDSSNGSVYVFSSDDGNGTCTGVDCAGVFKLSTSFPATSVGSEATVGSSSATPNPLYLGAFDSTYYASANATGNLYVCGNTGANPTLYQIPITAGTLPTAGQPLAYLTTLASTAACSPVTDLLNPNTAGGPSERLFVSATNDGTLSACLSGACIFNLITTPWQPFTAYTVGQQALSPRAHIVTVSQAGTSAGNDLSPWPTAPAGIYVDGTVLWIDQGSLAALFDTWQASHHYTTNKPKFLDSNGNVQVLTTNSLVVPLGITGASQPVWNTTPGGTTTDGTAPNTVTWTNVGPLGTVGLPVAGGTSGIIVDNIVGSGTVVGGSQVYFSTLSGGSCGGGCAIQASQPGLN